MKLVLLCCFGVLILGLTHCQYTQQRGQDEATQEKGQSQSRYVVLRDSYNGVPYVLTEQLCSFVQKKTKIVPQTVRYPCMANGNQSPANQLAASQNQGKSIPQQWYEKERQLEQLRRQQQQYIEQQKQQLLIMKQKQQQLQQQKFQKFHKQVREAYPVQYQQYLNRVQQAKEQQKFYNEKIQQYQQKIIQQQSQNQRQYDQKFQQYQQQYQQYREKYQQYRQQNPIQNPAYWNRVVVGTCEKTIEREIAYYEQSSVCCKGWTRNQDGLCVIPDTKPGQQAVCKNGGILKTDKGYTRCLCPPYYSGYTCEITGVEPLTGKVAPQQSYKQRYMKLLLERMNQKTTKPRLPNLPQSPQQDQKGNQFFNSLATMYKAKVFLHKFLQTYPSLRHQVVGVLAAKQLYDGQQKRASKGRQVANLMQNYIREKQKQLSIVTNSINQVLNMRKSLSRQIGTNRARVMYVLRDRMARVLKERMDNKRRLLKRLHQLRISMRLSKLAMLVKLKLLQSSIANKPEFQRFIGQINRQLGQYSQYPGANTSDDEDEDEQDGNVSGRVDLRDCVSDFDDQFKSCFAEFGMDAQQALFLTQTMAFGTIYSHRDILPLYRTLCGQRDLVEQCVTQSVVSCDGIPQMSIVANNVNRVFSMLDNICRNVPGSTPEETEFGDGGEADLGDGGEADLGDGGEADLGDGGEADDDNEVEIQTELECLNNGIAVSVEGVAGCRCPEGYSGELCETEEEINALDGDVIEVPIDDLTDIAIDPTVDIDPATDYSSDDSIYPVDTPSDSMYPEDTQTDGMYPVDTPTDNMYPVDTPTDMYPVDTPTDNMYPVDGPTDSMYPVDGPTDSMYPVDAPTDSMYPVDTPNDFMGLEDDYAGAPNDYAGEPNDYAGEPNDYAGELNDYAGESMVPVVEEEIMTDAMPSPDMILPQEIGVQSSAAREFQQFRAPYFTNCPQLIVTLTLPLDSNITQLPFGLDARDWKGNPLQMSVSQTSFAWKSHSIETVIATAQDELGHLAKCMFGVTVTDPFAPEFIYCPGDIRVSTDQEPVDWQRVVAKDNVRLLSAPKGDYKSGSTFRPGTTLVTYVAEDMAGNVAYCKFNVHVEKSVLAEKDILDGKVDAETLGELRPDLKPAVAKVVGSDSDVTQTKVDTMMIVVMSVAVGVLLIAILIAVVACVCLRRRKNVFVIEKKPEQLSEICTVSGRPPTYETKGIPPLSYEEVKGETIKGDSCDETIKKIEEIERSQF